MNGVFFPCSNLDLHNLKVKIVPELVEQEIIIVRRHHAWISDAGGVGNRFFRSVIHHLVWLEPALCFSCSNQHQWFVVVFQCWLSLTKSASSYPGSEAVAGSDLCQFFPLPDPWSLLWRLPASDRWKSLLLVVPYLRLARWKVWSLLIDSLHLQPGLRSDLEKLVGYIWSSAFFVLSPPMSSFFFLCISTDQGVWSPWLFLLLGLSSMKGLKIQY